MLVPGAQFFNLLEHSGRRDVRKIFHIEAKLEGFKSHT